MQNDTKLHYLQKRNLSSLNALSSKAFVTNPNSQFDDLIIKKQLEILEDAISRYNRLEEVKKFTKLVLEDIETSTEQDIRNALEIEQMAISEKDEQVKKLAEQEKLLKDILEGQI